MKCVVYPKDRWPFAFAADSETPFVRADDLEASFRVGRDMAIHFQDNGMAAAYDKAIAEVLDDLTNAVAFREQGALPKELSDAIGIWAFHRRNITLSVCQE